MKRDGALLLFPPIWEPDVPYLALPQLSGQLHRETIRHQCIDLNIAFWKAIAGREAAMQIWIWCRETYERAAAKGAVVCDVATLIGLREIARSDLDEFRSQAWKGALIAARYRPFAMCAWMQAECCTSTSAIRRQPWHATEGYHDPYFYLVSMSERTRSIGDVMHTVLHDEANPYVRFFAEQLSHEKIRAWGVCGISVVAVNQVIPALTLARHIRSVSPDARIILGGAWVTQLGDVLRHQPELFGLADAIVVGEGELPLCQFVDCCHDRASWLKIPNLLTCVGGVVQRGPDVRPHGCDAIPTPRFADFPLELYDCEGVLPLQTSRGCPWGKCKFCSYRILEPEYRERCTICVKEDIKALRTEYGAKAMCLVDSSLTPERLRTLGGLFADVGEGVRWRGFARLESGFTYDVFQQARRGGCEMLIWGMESASDRSLRSLGKGTDRHAMRRVLGAASRAGIHNRVCVIYGIPGETDCEFDETLRFIEDNRGAIHSVAASVFTYERLTELGTHLPGTVVNWQGAEEASLAIGIPASDEAGQMSLELKRQAMMRLRSRIEVAHSRPATP